MEGKVLHDYLATCGITYSEIMRLDELGLVNSSSLLVLKVRTTMDQAVAFNNDRLLVMIKPAGDDAVDLNIKQFPLTDVGRELYGVQDTATPDSCYKEFVKELSKNKKIAVELLLIPAIKSSLKNSLKTRRLLWKCIRSSEFMETKLSIIQLLYSMMTRLGMFKYELE